MKLCFGLHKINIHGNALCGYNAGLYCVVKHGGAWLPLFFKGSVIHVQISAQHVCGTRKVSV